MWAARVVTAEVLRQLLLGLGNALVRVEVDLLVFDALPQTFDENIVDPTPTSVHAYLNAVVREHLGEFVTRELASLIYSER